MIGAPLFNGLLGFFVSFRNIHPVWDQIVFNPFLKLGPEYEYMGCFGRSLFFQKYILGSLGV